MEKMNPIEQANYIRDEYKNYLKSSFKFENEIFQGKFSKALEEAELYKGPYLELNLPFKKGHNIYELQNDNFVCPSFAQLQDIDFNRRLYIHQEEAFKIISNKRNAIITTGTGSGKTECFLYPILNAILRDIENGEINPGIRSIFLYPMNALVNDQIDRIRKILANCPTITFGFFTGATPEKTLQNTRRDLGIENSCTISDNEIVSREEIRKNPPHLLFTNYSMLEYLLIRPTDYTLFKKEMLKDWKFVVLDEAHTYTGALGIEVSMLLRRLTGMSNKKPQFILTSATLGENGKSEHEILSFARNLTTSNFEKDDIVFSKREELYDDLIKYTVNPGDYLKIKENLDNIDIVKSIVSNYSITSENEIGEILYELLIKDKTTYQLYSMLNKEAKTFSHVSKSMYGNLNQNQLITLIDLINMAEKNNNSIFSLKYHSFVRALSGVYMTFSKDKYLTLTKTNYINGFKAFEIGNCRYCNSSYIIGKIVYNQEKGIEYLLQNDEIDIYENYGENDKIKLDYFLFEKVGIEEENENDNDIMGREYLVCSKCGCCYPLKNLNAKHCDCGEEYIFKAYKVIQKDNKKANNNIGKCLCCGHESQSGIVKSLNLGKDEGTAIIGQLLYETLEGNDEASCNLQTNKLSFKNHIVNKSEKRIKQFLAFSDSRQQASFFAVFFDANHTRILQKRLIWKIIEDNSFNLLDIDCLTSSLSAIIKERDLFNNELSYHKNAWITALVELLQVDGSYGGQGLGLFHFELDLNEIMIQFDDSEIEEIFGQYHLTRDDLETMIQVVFSVFRNTPAIKYVQSTLTPEEKQDALEYRRFDNYIALRNSKSVSYIKSFLPIIDNGTNFVSRYVCKICKCDVVIANEILEILYITIGIEAQLFTKHDTQEAYQINASRYVLKNYMTSKYYKCKKCGKITPFNIHNKCDADKCEGTLEECNPDVALYLNYYRKQYKTKKIERVVIKEHTAQLNRKIAKQSQNDFKNKLINILSCSTTFEMGIDIGDLNTVFMRNVPPTPANYSQRAGRSGRRKGSSPFVLTYCGIGSHDYTYFEDPEKMISGKITPPYFDVENERIVLRHLMAASLGYFFRIYPDYIKNIDNLVFNGGIDKFKSFLNGEDNTDAELFELSEYIDDKVLPKNFSNDYHNFGWINYLNKFGNTLDQFSERITSTVISYEESVDIARQNENYQDADFYQKQINTIKKERVIDMLSKYCIIPKYGFPVDVVDLAIYKDGVLDSCLDLNRDLKIALSEYAPDSEIIADGKKYTSKYITISKSKPFIKHFYRYCSKCGSINIKGSLDDLSHCEHCLSELDLSGSNYFIEPIYGFKSGPTKESARMKPKRSYAGEVIYIGGGYRKGDVLNIKDNIYVESTTDDQLLVLNKSTFYMCPICGYSEIDNDSKLTPNMNKKHKTSRLFTCQNEILNRIHLGHMFKTDVARFRISELSTSEENAKARSLSFLYALLEGISNIFNIERTDIDGLVVLDENASHYDLIIYDNVPGGAGHVKRIVNEDAIKNSLLESKRKVSQKCCDENTSCYNCLRNYYNQSYHAILKRKYALDVIDKLLDSLDI